MRIMLIQFEFVLPKLSDEEILKLFLRNDIQLRVETFEMLKKCPFMIPLALAHAKKNGVAIL